MEQVLQAIQDNDGDRLLRLYYWEGVDTELGQYASNEICNCFLELQYSEAYIEEASTDDRPGHYDGQSLIWTATPTRQIVLREVQADPGQKVSYRLPAAEINGVWYLVAAKLPGSDEVQPTAVIDEYAGPAANPRPAGGREKYEAVTIGMSRDKVFELLGNTMVQKLPKTDESHEVYEWQFRGGNISVGFSNNIAQWKANTFVSEPQP